MKYGPTRGKNKAKAKCFPLSRRRRNSDCDPGASLLDPQGTLTLCVQRVHFGKPTRAVIFGGARPTQATPLGFRGRIFSLVVKQFWWRDFLPLPGWIGQHFGGCEVGLV